MSATNQSVSILRLKDLQRRIPLSRSAIYAKISAGEFPAPIELGPRAIGWRSTDIDKWIASRRNQVAIAFSMQGEGNHQEG